MLRYVLHYLTSFLGYKFSTLQLYSFKRRIKFKEKRLKLRVNKPYFFKLQSLCYYTRRVITFFHTTTFNVYTSTEYMVSLSLANPSVSERDRPQFYVINKYNHQKQTRNRPCRPRGVQEVKAPRILDNGTVWWQVVSLTHQPPLPPGIFLVLIFTRG